MQSPRQNFPELKSDFPTPQERLTALRKQIFDVSMAERFEEADELLTKALTPAEHRVLLLEMFYAAHLTENFKRRVQLVSLATTKKERRMLMEIPTIDDKLTAYKDDLIQDALNNVDDFKDLESVDILIRCLDSRKKEEYDTLKEMLCDSIDKNNSNIAAFVLWLVKLVKPEEKMPLLLKIAKNYIEGGYLKQAILLLNLSTDFIERLELLKQMVITAAEAGNEAQVTFLINQSQSDVEHEVLLEQAQTGYIMGDHLELANRIVIEDEMIDLPEFNPEDQNYEDHKHGDQNTNNFSFLKTSALSPAASAPAHLQASHAHSPVNYHHFAQEQKIFPNTLSPHPLRLAPKKVISIAELSAFLDRISGTQTEDNKITRKRIKAALKAISPSEINRKNLILFLKCYSKREINLSSKMFPAFADKIDAANKADIINKFLDYIEEGRSLHLSKTNFNILVNGNKLLTQIIVKFIDIPALSRLKASCQPIEPRASQPTPKKSWRPF